MSTAVSVSTACCRRTSALSPDSTPTSARRLTDPVGRVLIRTPSGETGGSYSSSTRRFLDLPLDTGARPAGAGGLAVAAADVPTSTMAAAAVSPRAA